MEKWIKLAVSFIKRQYYLHLLIIMVFLGGADFFISFRNLTASDAAKTIEYYGILTAILLFTPLFMPEQDGEIRELIKSKATSMRWQYVLRFLIAFAAELCVIFYLLCRLGLGESEFPFWKLLRGSICEFLFLGMIGFFVSAVTNQVIIGYMLAFFYFVANIGGTKIPENIRLFSMMKGDYSTWEYWLAGAAILFLAGILWRERKSPGKLPRSKVLKINT